jgi:DNA polymerase-3 subunit epsilon
MMNHRDPAIRDRCILWARSILDKKNQYVVLDTETSGLDKNDVVLQIAIVDLDGNGLLNSLIKPTKRKRISPDATAIHGIRMSDLVNAPVFAVLVPQIEEIISAKTVLIYNAEFDERLISQTCEQDKCRRVMMKTECVMIPYSRYVGKWSDYHSSYAYQRLPGGDHTAMGDCYATLEVITKMARTGLRTQAT